MCFIRRFAYSTRRKPNRCQTLLQNHMDRLQQESSAPTLSERLEWLTRAPKRKWAALWGTLRRYCLLRVSAVIWGGQKIIVPAFTVRQRVERKSAGAVYRWVPDHFKHHHSRRDQNWNKDLVQFNFPSFWKGSLENFLQRKITLGWQINERWKGRITPQARLHN